MRAALALIWVAALVSACSHAPLSAQRSPQAQDPFPVRSVSIQIKQIQRNLWEAAYQIDVPVERLYFEYSYDHFRPGRWTPTDSNWILEQEGNKELILRKDHQPFQTVSLRFEPYAEFLQGGFNFSIPFKDGSSALYSSYFLVHGSQPPATEFTLFPLQGQDVVVNGQVSHESLNWPAPAGQFEYGSYLYFGKIRPTQKKEFVGLLDAKLPNWVKREILKILPRAFSHLSTRLGPTSFGKPYVIVNRWPNPREQHRFGGGAADRWIQLGLAGKSWDKESKAGHEKLFAFITHELSHFWTAQKRRDFERLAWINEGGANFFANELALELKLISKKEHDHRVMLASQSCISLLKEHPETVIAQTASGMDARIGYECGHAIHATLDQLLRQSDPQRDLFSFWNELLKRARVSNQGLYSETEYFALAREWIKNPKLIELENLVTEPARNANVSLLLSH